jgi:hypothetical protein
VEPDEKAGELYRRLAPVFDETYGALEPVYQRLKGFV